MEKTEFSIQIDTAEEPMKQEEAVSKVHEKLEKQEPLIELRNACDERADAKIILDSRKSENAVLVIREKEPWRWNAE